MKSLCIKTNDSNLLEYLLNELKNLDLDNVFFSSKIFKHYNNIIIHYKGNDTTKFFSEISSILCFLVIDHLEENFLNRIIYQNYFYFDKFERIKILENCFELNSENFFELFDKKFSILHSCFLDFISANRNLVLSGFINFRLKDYIKILDSIVNESVNNFLIEKEYNEFISLLKLYINTQPINCKAVHIIYSSTNSILLDENKNIIDISSDIFKSKYLSDISFSSNDYILNSLLTLLPNKIFIHLIDNNLDEFVNTLQLVFENKVEICTDCSICAIYKNSNKLLIKK